MCTRVSPDDTFGLPSQRFAYQLGAPVSRIVASERSNGASGTYDLTTAQCFDGAGHALQTRRWESGSRYIVEGLSFYNPRGEVSKQYQAYGSKEAGCELAAPYGVRSTLTYRDGTRRVMRDVLPDHDERPVASKRVTGYGPLRETVWDEEDWDDASPHYRTPATRVRDGLGRLVGVIRRLGTGGGAAKTRFTYSELGALRSVIDGMGNEKWQEHDLLGRVVRVHDPDAGERRFEYDPLGNVIDRYGSELGTFAAPVGTPFGMRSLPPQAASAPLRAYEVLRPLPTQSGTSVPWFGQLGGGTQYEFSQSIESLVQQGYLQRLP